MLTRYSNRILIPLRYICIVTIINFKYTGTLSTYHDRFQLEQSCIHLHDMHRYVATILLLSTMVNISYFLALLGVISGKYFHARNNF